MSKNALILFLALSMLLNAAFVGECIHAARTGTQSPVKPRPAPEAVTTVITDWDTFTLALAWVESRWDDDAESDRQAVGYLQVTPILVEDANRIEGRETFTLDGRRDREESIRLFNVIQDHYNPGHDLNLALKIWNPRSKLSYHTAVISKYNELKQQPNNNTNNYGLL